MRVGFAASVTIPFSCVRRSHRHQHLLPDWVETAALVMLTLGEDPSPFENVQGVVDHLGSAGLEITFG